MDDPLWEFACATASQAAFRLSRMMWKMRRRALGAMYAASVTVPASALCRDRMFGGSGCGDCGKICAGRRGEATQ